MPSTVRREVEAEDEYLRGLPTPTSSVPSPVEPLRRSVRRSSLTRVRPSFTDTSAELPEAPEDGTGMLFVSAAEAATVGLPALASMWREGETRAPIRWEVKVLENSQSR